MEVFVVDQTTSLVDDDESKDSPGIRLMECSLGSR